jgi:putative DNA primase/helicase
MATRVEIYDSQTETWPKPEPLGDDLPRVMQFNSELLPASFRPLVEDVSERMQTPPDFAAATAINALAGCVNRRALVEPKAHDTSFRKPCNLWGGIIGPPGLLKSPLMEAVTYPLTAVEKLWRAEYESELSAYELQTEEQELVLQAWKEGYKAAEKKGAPKPIRPDSSVRRPTQRRLILQDATFEKLHEILSENPTGVLVSRDELTGWLSELDRPGREGERAFFLSAWNGTTGHSIERIGRGSVYVPACCVSLFGGITPARLRTYLQDALEDGPANDGLMQRFQNLVWPDTPAGWELIDRLPDAEAQSRTKLVFERLASLSADEPRLLKFSLAAQQLFDAWLQELETTKLRGDTLHPAMVAHLSKYRSLMPVLGGLFELSDWAAGLGGGDEISLNHCKQAAGYCEYLESHARRVYACIVSPELRAARELARRLTAGELRERFTVRQVYQHDWAGLTTPSRVRAATEILQEAGWLRPAEPDGGPGRPTEAFLINPRILEDSR